MTDVEITETLTAPAEDHDALGPEAESNGISEPLSRQVDLLGTLLGQAIRERFGDDAFGLVEHLRGLAQDGALDEAASLVADQTPERLHAVIRAYTTFFHLVNKAEQLEIVRINRERDRDAEPDAPRGESVAEAVYTLKAQGASFDEALASIAKLDIQPTLTAHPTEARRRTVLFQQNAIADALSELQRTDPPPNEAEALTDSIARAIHLLLATDEVRPTAVTVEDEVRHGLYFVATSIWEAVPRLHADLRRALRQAYPDAADDDRLNAVPPFLRYRSWIGGDRDGNPRVTAEVTAWTLRAHREDALRLYRRALDGLRLSLSVSDLQTDVLPDLIDSIKRDQQTVTLEERRLRQHAHEPYRLKLLLMQARLDRLIEQLDGPADGDEREAYSAADFRADLALIARSLRAADLGSLADDGPLADLRVQAETFGFHLATLDLRQHSRVHEAATADLFRLAGVAPDYGALDEEARVTLLSEELRRGRTLLPPGMAPGDETQGVLDVLKVAREAYVREPDAIGAYIVSMTSDVSDMLEVLLLFREAGLWHRHADGSIGSMLDVVPLFETIADLEAAGIRLERLFSHPIYVRHLIARNRFQEIMLGYSDSNKDGGYWMANWALHEAQGVIAHTCRRFGLDFRLFHGRGGTVGRGGGRANQAIRALPPAAQTGRIRFTEQGEVISFRYALEGIAHRHLEQIVHAQLVALAEAEDDPDERAADTDTRQLMERLAADSMETYRALVDDPDFWPWYRSATPINHIAGLPMASRPISRKKGAELDFDGLRAIPWVFAWTQTRYTVPGWYGIGAALDDATDDDATLERLQRLYQTWPFFQAIVGNALREMARARLEIAQRYAARARRKGSLHTRIADEFERAEDALLAITDQERLLTHSPVIEKSIALRNPYTDVLNLVQIELMRRAKKGRKGDAEAVQEALLVSINGIAAAMQSTG